MEEEMKQKNEEILERWRGLGFLQGLKKGSINEWRCAKSIDLLVCYLIVHTEEEDKALSEFAIAFIRRALCSGKKRLHRIIQAKDIVEFFNGTKISEIHDYMAKQLHAPKTNYKKVMRQLFFNLLSMDDVKDLSLREFLNKYSEQGENTFVAYKKLLSNTKLDVEAELLCFADDFFVEKNS